MFAFTDKFSFYYLIFNNLFMEKLYGRRAAFGRVFLPLLLLLTGFGAGATASPFAISVPWATAVPAGSKEAFYAIRVYQLKTQQQEARVDSFLQNALIPALHR